MKNLGPAIFAGLLAFPAISGETGVTELSYLESQKIIVKSEGLREPSGLALASDGKHFWTVSDDTSAVFRIGLDGDLKPSHTINSRLNDAEGVTEDVARNRLLAVSEATSEIVVIDLKDGSTTVIPLRQIDGFKAVAKHFIPADGKDGLEGITVNPSTGAVFLIKEKRPRLILELSSDLSRIRGALILTADMGFKDERVADDDLDVSGLAYDSKRRAFWITSDTGKRLFLFDPLTKIAQSWPLTVGSQGKRLDNAEGVALGKDGTVVFVVNDDGKASRLISYALN